MTQYAFLALGILLGVVGQFFLKTGADAVGIVEQFLRPTTIMGLGCYGFAAICYTLALRSIPLSVAYPSVSISYAIVVVAAHLLWKEPLGAQQILAISMITGGIALLYWRA
jgi:small multidrug resistance pump